VFDFVDGVRSGVVAHKAPRRLSGGYYDKAPTGESVATTLAALGERTGRLISSGVERTNWGRARKRIAVKESASVSVSVVMPFLGYENRQVVVRDRLRRSIRL
jgi:hypothetical protein